MYMEFHFEAQKLSSGSARLEILGHEARLGLDWSGLELDSVLKI